jgi:hypothetical protein
MALTGAQLKSLAEAIQAAYPSYKRLDRMMAYELDRELARVSAPAGMEEVVFELIRVARAEDWVEELATGALQANPRNPALRALFADGVFDPRPPVRRLLADDADDVARALLPPTHVAAIADLPDRRVLETMVNEAAGYLDVVPWTVALLEHVNRVCRIEANTPLGTKYGTGFLVAADKVLTNHHVLDQVMRSGETSGVRFRFDFRVNIKNEEELGSEYGLTTGEWLLAASPPSQYDSAPRPDASPTADELDYALVTLDAAPGNDLMLGGARRGWINLADSPANVATGLPLIIIQHPKMLPVKLALDARGVLDTNRNRTRITYSVNTEPGSSGAPCLGFDFAPVALHHAGEPYFNAGRNEGVPLAAIVAHLRREGRAEAVRI